MIPVPSRLKRFTALLRFALVAMALLGGGAATIYSWPALRAKDGPVRYRPVGLGVAYTQITQKVGELQDRQTRTGIQVVSPAQLRSAVTEIELRSTARQFVQARRDISRLQGQVDTWNAQLTNRRQAEDTGIPSELPTGAVTVPILLYHYTPANFREQLSYLQDHGYTVISLDKLSSAMDQGARLPDKPVVLTFDDGFANQLQAFDLLREFKMPATFYIVTAGENSRWCIGAGRRYHDPLQPPEGCGDAYLSWDQVRMLDKSGLITIGSHTVDHENLAASSPERQRFEIMQGKAQLEAQLGHAVKHFCYPYGAFTATTLELVREAGFATATTTAPGTIQAAGTQLTLLRVRDTLSLP